jgi:hypothetical protein
MDLSVIAMIGIILLIGIVKKNAILVIDVALDLERNHGLGAPRRHPSSVPAAVPADLDDDDGRATRRLAAGPRHRHRLPSSAARSASPSWADCS